MCTLTYLPKATGFLFTGNRDESVERKPALLPTAYNINGLSIVFPKDGEAGGTWMAASKKLTACLMNGAFEQHLPQPPYRKSRGLVLLDLFNYTTLEKFSIEYDCTGIEPFTIVAVAEGNINEIRWDGCNLYFTILPKNKPEIWSSAQMYPPEVRQQREEWFSEWLKERSQYKRDEILQFHRFKSEADADEEKILIDRGFLKTVSISSIDLTGNNGNFLYYDLASNLKEEVQF